MPTRTEHPCPISRAGCRYREAPRPVEAEIEWPEIEFASRATQDDIEAGRWRIAAAAITPTSYRLSPGILAALLFSGSLAFLFVAAFLAWQLVGRRQEEIPEPVVDARPPLAPADLDDLHDQLETAWRSWRQRLDHRKP